MKEELKIIEQIDIEKFQLNMIYVTDFAFFPDVQAEVIIKNPKDIQALKYAYNNKMNVAVMYTLFDELQPNICKFSCSCEIKSMTIVDNSAKALLLGKSRIEKLYDTLLNDMEFGIFKSIIPQNNDYMYKDNTILIDTIKKMITKLLKNNNAPLDKTVAMLENTKDIEKFINALTPAIIGQGKEMVFMLSEKDVNKRLRRLCDGLDILTNPKHVVNEVINRVNQKLMKAQKEMFLREELKVINEELYGDVDEIETLRLKIIARQMPKEIESTVLKELVRMQKLVSGSPEVGYIRNYIETMIDLPWIEKTKENIEINKSLEILNKNHYGLKKVKEAIIEFLAVLKKINHYSGQILCFVGPPGTGKTSIAKSIATALNRDFVQVSLGGISDESIIRGHRRTYIGAMPGRIITAMKQAKSINPVFLLDEVDKMTSDIKGDPSSALLEVLDPEQNVRFKDHFIETEYDLSQVFFICTANDKNNIPAPLLDRMEIIELNTYTDDEKFNIGKYYLLPKLIEKNGLKINELSIDDQTLMQIINNYTMEAGVRNLERNLNKICRKVVLAIETSENMQENKQFSVNNENLQTYLGAPTLPNMSMFDGGNVGEVVGLGYTSFGGMLILNEISLSEGKGELKFTGKLGDVYKEVVQLALSVVKSLAKEYNINNELFTKNNIHVHFPEMAIGKDGPSGGTALVVAMISAFTNRPYKKHLGITGEVTLRGRVLPIGGLKEKFLASMRFGLKEVIVPASNKADVDELKELIDGKLTVHFTSSIQEVLQIALQ